MYVPEFHEALHVQAYYRNRNQIKVNLQTKILVTKKGLKNLITQSNVFDLFRLAVVPYAAINLPIDRTTRPPGRPKTAPPALQRLPEHLLTPEENESRFMEEDVAEAEVVLPVDQNFGKTACDRCGDWKKSGAGIAAHKRACQASSVV
jgi:hypothetical protein